MCVCLICVHTVSRSGQVMSGQVRSGHVMSGQVIAVDGDKPHVLFVWSMGNAQ